MINYYSQTCDVCGKQFVEGDDIVVCPDCGTPHHRECWFSTGHCVNEEKHAQGFEWKPVQILGVNTAAVKCPKCGSLMPEGTKFCENCGAQLTQPAPAPQQNPYQPQNRGGYGSPFNTSFEDFNTRMQQEMSGEIDGVPVRDIYTFIGPNAFQIVHKFKRMQQQPGYKPFDFFAFMFRPLWFLSKNMWRYAIRGGALNLVLGIPSMILTAVEQGMLASSSPLVFAGIERVASVLFIVEMFVNSFWGFMAIPLYKKFVIKKIKQYQDMHSGDPEGYYRELVKHSGPSKIGMGIVLVLMVFYLIALLI